MSQKTRIAILGLGAVGGYLGAYLAKKYKESKDVEIIFITREKTKNIILEKGLKLITPAEEFISFPAHTYTNTENTGPLDFIICTVKSYDLEEALLPLKNSISSGTVILPLLNGVDAKERIAGLFPGTDVWDGCVYIISRLTEPGVIKENGNIHTFHFGSETASADKLKHLETIFKAAGIDCRAAANIQQTIWEKFIFISVVASLTTFLNKAIGPILENEEHRKLAYQLLTELRAVADAKKTGLPDMIIEKSIATMERMPYETTSSMHSDHLKGGKTEYRSLTEYVVNEGKRLNVPVPEYEKVLKGVRK
jgi:2-dehydropantoate 2-reductase